MTTYLNEASLQGQFPDAISFGRELRALLQARAGSEVLRQNFRLTRAFSGAPATTTLNVRAAVQQCRDRDLTGAVMAWLDKRGPFIDDDRLSDPDDYFEFAGLDVTAGGLGEAARRTKFGAYCCTFSFVGGQVNFALDPLHVDHGLPEDRLGRYAVTNTWDVVKLLDFANSAEPMPTCWHDLVKHARRRFSSLDVADLHLIPALAREPFEASVRDRALALMAMLNEYAQDRDINGCEGESARQIVKNFFTGARALFTGESETNERTFRNELTFVTQNGEHVFAPWHGKISHRYFRLHFEWPLSGDRRKLRILYLGPKITRS